MSDIRCRKCHRKKRVRHNHTEQSYERTRPLDPWQDDIPPPPPPPPPPVHVPAAPSATSSVPPRPPHPPAPATYPLHLYPQIPTAAEVHSLVHTAYHIKNISADPRQPKHERAQDMLQSLQFLCHNIMSKHNLRVDNLWELDPTHHGVNGCNIGQGQEVMIRPRNETNSDFRSTEEIMDTMLHELAHNRYPEHDRHFYDFWNTLRREYEALRTNGYAQQEPVKGISFFRSRPQYKKLPSRSAFPLKSCRISSSAPSMAPASWCTPRHSPAVAPPAASAQAHPGLTQTRHQAAPFPHSLMYQPSFPQAMSPNPSSLLQQFGAHSSSPYALVPNAAEPTFFDPRNHFQNT